MGYEELAQKIMEARVAYYYGDPVMSDAEFEKLEHKLRLANPDHPALTMVGAPVPGKEKVHHQSPMGSLSNAMNRDELVTWMKKIPSARALCAQHKMDGLSIELVYQQGYFQKAITRGDGTVETQGTCCGGTAVDDSSVRTSKRCNWWTMVFTPPLDGGGTKQVSVDVEVRNKRDVRKARELFMTIFADCWVQAGVAVL